MTADLLTTMCQRAGAIRTQFAEFGIIPPWELIYLHDSLVGMEKMSAATLNAEQRDFVQKHTMQLLQEFAPRALASIEARLSSHQQIMRQKSRQVVATLVRLFEANQPIAVDQLTEMCRYLRATPPVNEV
jgi:hypothetical protein